MGVSLPDDVLAVVVVGVCSTGGVLGTDVSVGVLGIGGVVLSCSIKISPWLACGDASANSLNLLVYSSILLDTCVHHVCYLLETTSSYYCKFVLRANCA